MPKPPVAVSKILSGVLVAFGHTDLSWKSIKSFISRMEFLKLIVNFDKDHVDYKTCKKINSHIKDLSSEKVANVNKGALGMYSWLKKIVNYRVYLALVNNERVPERKGAGKKKNGGKKGRSKP